MATAKTNKKLRSKTSRRVDMLSLLTKGPVILGQFGPPTLACLRSWGRNGLSPGMISIQGLKEPPPNSRYLSAYALLPTNNLYTTEGITIIARFLEGFQAEGLICINEKTACWLHDNRQFLPPKTALCLPPKEVIVDVLSKTRQIQVAREVGLPVLTTYLIYTPGFNPSTIPDSEYPLCLRPGGGSGAVRPAFKVLLLKTPEALSTFLKGLKHLSGTLIAQPFKNLPNLVVHGARTVGGRSQGMQAFLVERKFEGVTLSIRPFEISEDLKCRCKTFADDFGITGPYHFEFLLDQPTGKAWFLELNSRLGGTTSKVMACGYDEPAYALASYNLCPEPSCRIREVTVSNKQATLKYLAHALTGRLTPLDYPDAPRHRRILSAIRGFINHKDDVLSFEDPRGSWAYYLSNAKSWFRKLV